MDKLSFLRSAERRSISPESASAMAERVQTINEFAGNLAMADRREFPEMFEQAKPEPEMAKVIPLTQTHSAEVKDLAVGRILQEIEVIHGKAA